MKLFSMWSCVIALSLFSTIACGQDSAPPQEGPLLNQKPSPESGELLDKSTTATVGSTSPVEQSSPPSSIPVASGQNNMLANCSSEGVSIQNNEIVFNVGKSGPHIFLIQNTSSGKVMLNHIKADAGASAGWASAIDKGNWSALSLTRANFSMGCMLYSPPKFGLIDCGNVVSVCAIPTSTTSEGWMAEDMTLDKIREKLKSRGINM